MYKKILPTLAVVLLAFTTIACGTNENADEGIATLEPLESIEETQVQDEILEQEDYSIDITTPLEDVQAIFENCKESYEYYGELLTEALTTVEMVEYSGKMYEVADKCLNDIWDLIRNHVDEEQFEQILAEQRAWIVEKEKRASESAAMYEGGSFAAVDYNDVLASMTYERCEELIEYLK